VPRQFFPAGGKFSVIALRGDIFARNRAIRVILPVRAARLRLEPVISGAFAFLIG